LHERIDEEPELPNKRISQMSHFDDKDGMMSTQLVDHTVKRGGFNFNNEPLISPMNKKSYHNIMN
jgi:hypothetical protein